MYYTPFSRMNKNYRLAASKLNISRVTDCRGNLMSRGCWQPPPPLLPPSPPPSSPPDFRLVPAGQALLFANNERCSGFLICNNSKLSHFRPSRTTGGRRKQRRERGGGEEEEKCSPGTSLFITLLIPTSALFLN